VAVHVNHILNGVDFPNLMVFIFASITAVSLALIVCLKLGDTAGENLEKLDYHRLIWCVIKFMSFLVALFSFLEQANVLMVVVTYITSISLGLLPHYLDLNKSHLMGVLILPAIVVYAGLG